MKRRQQIAQLKTSVDADGKHLSGRVQLGALRKFLRDVDRGDAPHAKVFVRWHAPDAREQRGEVGLYVEVDTSDPEALS